MTGTTKAGESNNWVYPSAQQFYTSLARKNRSPDARDMDIVVPIHNAVNERCWDQVLQWEAHAGVAKDDVKLVTFEGKPHTPSPKAWLKTLAGCDYFCQLCYSNSND